MTDVEHLLLVGKVRPERRRSITGMAAVAKLHLVALEDPSEALEWLEANEPACVVVEASTGRIDRLVGKVRSKPGLVYVPIFALVQVLDDLFIEQYFGWGGDDIVLGDAGASLLERLKSVRREGPKPVSGRRVLLADPDKARLDLVGRVFAQAGFEVHTASNRSVLETVALQVGPQCIVANAVLGEITGLVAKTRQLPSNPGWVVLSARREIEAVQVALSAFDRCAVLGVQSNPWQLLHWVNEVARADAVERRAEVRRQFGAAVLFRDAGGDDDDIGICADVSSRGMFVRTFAPLVADKVWLEWRMPQEKTRLRFEGNVVWRQVSVESMERGSSPLGFGVEFVDALGASERHLERLLLSLTNAPSRGLSAPPSARVVAAVARPGPVEPPTLRKSEPPSPPVDAELSARPSAFAMGVEPPTLQKSLGSGSSGGAEPTVTMTSKSLRSLSLPPRPSGSLVVTSNQTKMDARSALVAGSSTSSVLGDGALDEWDTNSGGTDATQKPTPPVEGAEGLPAFSHPDILPAFSYPGNTAVDVGEDLNAANGAAGAAAPSGDSASKLPAFSFPSSDTSSVRSSGPVSAPEVSDAQPTAPVQGLGFDERPVGTSPRRRWLILGAVVAILALGALAARLWPRTGRVGIPSAPVAKVAAPVAATTSLATSMGATSTNDAADAGSEAESDAGTESAVYADPGGAIAGYPMVEDGTAEQGSALSERYGYLVVRFPEPAFIFFENTAIGPVNAKIATPCGDKTLRIGVGEKPTTYLSEAGSVTVACRGTTKVVFRRLPGVVTPPNATLPSLPGRGKTADQPSVGGVDEKTPGTKRAPVEPDRSGAAEDVAAPRDESKSAAEKAIDPVSGVPMP